MKTLLDAPQMSDSKQVAEAAKEPTRILRELHEDGTVVLTFDRPDAGANIFDLATLNELNSHLEWIAEQSGLKGLILISAKPSIFIAGADLDALERLPEQHLKRFLERGQEVFNHLADLKIPTVGAIHGACMGGGLEVALACDWRVGSDSKATSLGLPETQLGILPAWGGSTRLPKLIGLQKALSVILPGKPMAAKKALKLGVIDSVVHPENLLAEAKEFIARGKRPSKSLLKENNLFTVALVRFMAERKLRQQLRGHYPAPLAALEVASLATRSSVDDSLGRERNAILELARTETTKNLIGIFQLQQRSKKIRFDAGGDPKRIERTAVIGAGVMGAGIAQWTSSRGLPVILQDIDEERVAAGLRTARKLFADGQKRRIFSELEVRDGLDRISPAATPVPLTATDLVIEAAVEDLSIKKKIFADLCARSRPDTILATNTSALPIGELATSPGITHPERILGLHFFNPVHRMKLVEVVVTEHTSAESVETALALVKRLGKMPVIVQDSPGFLVNRILMPYLIMAGRLFANGVDAQRIDKAMLEFGMPMGPLRLLDEVGLDVALHVARTMESAFGERLKTPNILKLLVEAGHLGRKSGSGFYLYEGKSKGAPVINEQALNRRSLAQQIQLAPDVITDLLSLMMVDEAARCLEQGVVESPKDVDFAMIMGTGWAPFRGGPLRYADSLGVGIALDRLVRAADAAKEPLQPSGRLQEVAQARGSFHEDS